MLDANALTRNRRREPQNLQLTSLIDVFSIIIFFLILGSVLAETEIRLPQNIELPKREQGAEPLPGLTVVLSQDSSSTRRFYLEMPDWDFRAEVSDGANPIQTENGSALGARLLQLKLQRQNRDGKLPPVYHFVADRSVPYSVVFQTTQLLQQAGLTPLQLLAEGEKL